MTTVNFESSASPANSPAASHQRPHHRDGKRDQRDVRRHLGHQQPVIKRGLRHQHRNHDRANVMRHPPDRVGEQQLGDQHGQHAGKPDAQIGVAEDRGAEPDEPRDHRRMIEERKHVLLRPGPVIGFVGAQIYHACVDHPQCRHRDDQHHSGRQLPKDGSFRFRVDTVGRGNRHDAFSPTPDRVSTSWEARSCRDQGYQCCACEIDYPRRRPGERGCEYISDLILRSLRSKRLEEWTESADSRQSFETRAKARSSG